MAAQFPGERHRQKRRPVLQLGHRSVSHLSALHDRIRSVRSGVERDHHRTDQKHSQEDQPIPATAERNQNTTQKQQLQRTAARNGREECHQTLQLLSTVRWHRRPGQPSEHLLRVRQLRLLSEHTPTGKKHSQQTQVISASHRSSAETDLTLQLAVC